MNMQPFVCVLLYNKAWKPAACDVEVEVASGAGTHCLHRRPLDTPACFSHTLGFRPLWRLKARGCLWHVDRQPLDAALPRSMTLAFTGLLGCEVFLLTYQI